MKRIAKKSLPSASATSVEGDTLVAEIIPDPAMQNQPDTLPAKDRIDRLQRTLDITLLELARRLRISATTIHGIRAGRTPLTDRVAARLEQLEAGIGKPAGEPTTTRSTGSTHILSLMLRLSAIQGSNQDLIPQGPKILVQLNYNQPEPTLPKEVLLETPGSLPGMEAFMRAVVSGSPQDIVGVILPCLPHEYANTEFLNKLAPTTIAKLLEASLRVIFGEHWQAVLATAVDTPALPSPA